MTNPSARVEIVRKARCELEDAAIRAIAAAAVRAGGLRRAFSLAVVLTADAEVRRLNRRWRGLDKTTDVLSFGNAPSPRLRGAGDRREREMLGDIIISVPQVRRQAAERGIPVRRELALMVAHGALHLLGYDHATRKDEKRMFGLQERVLKRLKYA